jgi:RNA polymerase sigma factor (sigma-70 family)
MPETATELGWIREVMDRFERPLLRYAIKVVGDEEQARDVVQDTFCRLHAQRRDRVEPKLAEWLYTVCRNRALDVRKKEGRMSGLSDMTLAARPSPEPGPAAVAETKDSARKMTTLIGALPANQQEVLRLKFEHGMSYQEIAAITSLSVSNVGYLLHVAIKALGQRLSS